MNTKKLTKTQKTMKVTELPKNIFNSLYYRSYQNHPYDSRKNGYATTFLNGSVVETENEYRLYANRFDLVEYTEYVSERSYFENYPPCYIRIDWDAPYIAFKKDIRKPMTRCGYEVQNLFKFDGVTSGPIYAGVVNGEVETWYEDGSFLSNGKQNLMDLVL